MKNDNNLKLLMICYHFPPMGSVGAKRSSRFVSLLKELDLDLRVLTVRRAGDKWALYTGDEVPDVLVKRSYEFPLGSLTAILHGLLLRLLKPFGVKLKKNYFREFLCFPDSQIAWNCFFAALPQAIRCDAIYVSCSPFSSAVCATLLKIFCRKKLVLDFRDPWSLNPHVALSGFSGYLLRQLEEFCITRADKLILNTPGSLCLYREAYPKLASKMSCIPNSYGTVSCVESFKSDTKYRILHVGSFYGKRSPERLLAALESLGDPEIVFTQVGGTHPLLESYKDSLNIEITGALPYTEALEKMRGASLLYLAQGFEEGVERYVPIAAKTYEYIASGLPILVHAPKGDNVEIVENYAACSYSVCEDSVEALGNAIAQAKAEFPGLTPEVKKEFIRDFDPITQASQLADIIK